MRKAFKPICRQLVILDEGEGSLDNKLDGNGIYSDLAGIDRLYIDQCRKVDRSDKTRFRAK